MKAHQHIEILNLEKNTLRKMMQKFLDRDQEISLISNQEEEVVLQDSRNRSLSPNILQQYSTGDIKTLPKQKSKSNHKIQNSTFNQIDTFQNSIPIQEEEDNKKIAALKNTPQIQQGSFPISLNSSVVSQIQQQNDLIAILQQRIQSMQKDLNSAQQNQNDLINQLTRERSQNIEYKTNISQLIGQLDLLKSQITNLQEYNQQHKQKLQIYQDQLAKQEQIKNHVNSLSKEFENLQEKLEDIEKEKEEYKQSLEKKKQTNTQVSHENQNLKEIIDELQQKLQEQEDVIAQFQSKAEIEKQSDFMMKEIFIQKKILIQFINKRQNKNLQQLFIKNFFSYDQFEALFSDNQHYSDIILKLLRFNIDILAQFYDVEYNRSNSQQYTINGGINNLLGGLNNGSQSLHIMSAIPVTNMSIIDDDTASKNRMSRLTKYGSQNNILNGQVLNQYQAAINQQDMPLQLNNLQNQNKQIKQEEQEKEYFQQNNLLNLQQHPYQFSQQNQIQKQQHEQHQLQQYNQQMHPQQLLQNQPQQIENQKRKSSVNEIFQVNQFPQPIINQYQQFNNNQIEQKSGDLNNQFQGKQKESQLDSQNNQLNENQNFYQQIKQNIISPVNQSIHKSSTPSSNKNRNQESNNQFIIQQQTTQQIEKQQPKQYNSEYFNDITKRKESYDSQFIDNFNNMNQKSLFSADGVQHGIVDNATNTENMNNFEFQQHLYKNSANIQNASDFIDNNNKNMIQSFLNEKNDNKDDQTQNQQNILDISCNRNIRNQNDFQGVSSSKQQQIIQENKNSQSNSPNLFSLSAQSSPMQVVFSDPISVLPNPQVKISEGQISETSKQNNSDNNDINNSQVNINSSSQTKNSDPEQNLSQNIQNEVKPKAVVSQNPKEKQESKIKNPIVSKNISSSAKKSLPEKQTTTTSYDPKKQIKSSSSNTSVINKSPQKTQTLQKGSSIAQNTKQTSQPTSKTNISTNSSILSKSKSTYDMKNNSLIQNKGEHKKSTSSTIIKQPTKGVGSYSENKKQKDQLQQKIPDAKQKYKTDMDDIDKQLEMMKAEEQEDQKKVSNKQK